MLISSGPKSGSFWQAVAIVSNATAKVNKFLIFMTKILKNVAYPAKICKLLKISSNIIVK